MDTTAKSPALTVPAGKTGTFRGTATLLDGLKRGEEAALYQLMRLYKTKIFHYLYLLLKDRETAEELTQDTFVKAYFKAHTLKTASISPWLYKIATNLARSEWRKKKLKTFSPLPDSHPELFRVAPRFEEELVTEEMIAGIPGKYRVPFVLKVIKEFSYEDISLILDKPVGTVKSLVFRAKDRLKKKYETQI